MDNLIFGVLFSFDYFRYVLVTISNHFMKLPFSLLFLVFVISNGLLTSCDKHRAKKLSGTYSCVVDYRYFDISGTSIDSTYNEDIYIDQDGKNLIVLGTSIHIDSLWKEKEYSEGYFYDQMTVLFKDDQVYITKSGGGQGGSSSLNYVGVKQ